MEPPSLFAPNHHYSIRSIFSKWYNNTFSFYNLFCAFIHFFADLIMPIISGANLSGISPHTVLLPDGVQYPLLFFYYYPLFSTSQQEFILIIINIFTSFTNIAKIRSINYHSHHVGLGQVCS